MLKLPPSGKIVMMYKPGFIFTLRKQQKDLSTGEKKKILRKKINYLLQCNRNNFAVGLVHYQ